MIGPACRIETVAPPGMTLADGLTAQGGVGF